MSPITEPLVLDLVAWIAREPRPYVEVMDAWRTSCPRLMVWEEAVDRGLVERRQDEVHGSLVVVTAKGRSLVRDDDVPCHASAPKPARHA